MKPTIVVRDRDEGIELHQLDAMIESPAWKRYEAKLTAMQADAAQLTATCDDALKLRRAQGAIASLKRVRELPGILRDEILKKQKRQPGE